MPVFSSVLALLQRLQLARDVSRAGSLQVQAIADVLTILKSSSCTALDLDACQPSPLPFPLDLCTLRGRLLARRYCSAEQLLDALQKQRPATQTAQKRSRDVQTLQQNLPAASRAPHQPMRMRHMPIEDWLL